MFNCQLLKQGSAQWSVSRYDSKNEQPLILVKVRNSCHVSLSYRCNFVVQWDVPCECESHTHRQTDRLFGHITIALSHVDVVMWCLLCTVSCICIRGVCAAYVFFNLQNKYLTQYYVNMCHVSTDTKSYRPCPWYRNWLKTLD